MAPALETTGLVKRFGGLVAIDDVLSGSRRAPATP